jgi:hypothetical protein
MKAVLLALAAASAALAGASGAFAAAGPVAALRPTVTGTLQQGRKLTGNPGTWTGSGTIAYAYQWHRCDPSGAHCSSIHGSTRATYTQVAKDTGHTLGLTVRATDATGTTAAYSSLAGIVVAAGKAAAQQPPLTGDSIVGRPLQVDLPGATAAAATYGWRRCNANGRNCAAIPGVTTGTYTVAGADAGHVLLAAVTLTLDGAKQVVLSLASGLVRAAPGPVYAAVPTISGTFQQGKRLTASAGAWSGSGAVSYAYQWYRCDRNGARCSAIRGSTKPTYTQVAADVGHTLALTVRATDSTGLTPAYSSLAGLVAAKASTLAVTAQPTLAGTAAVGQALKVTGGAFDSTPTSPTYGWLRCNANGRLCTAIAGAASGSYTLTTADAGHAIVATATVAAGAARQVALTTAATVPL